METLLRLFGSFVFPRKTRRATVIALRLAMCGALSAFGSHDLKADPKDVLTQHNDNLRTGLYPSETVLNPSLLKSGNFNLLFDIHLEDPTDQIYAQPLYVHNLFLPSRDTTGNVLFVATEHNMIYAFDADGGTIIWHSSLGGPPTSQQVNNQGFYTIFPNVGVTSTPVIDRTRGLLYVVSVSTESPICPICHMIYAIDITTGSVKNHQRISCSLPQCTILGNGGGSSNGTLAFDPRNQVNRAGLLLQGNIVYVAFGGAFEHYPYHGWVFGYNADTLLPVTQLPYVTNPNGDGAGIWQSGNGLAGEGEYLYVATGNGGNDTATPPAPNYYGAADDPDGSSVVKIFGSSLQRVDWFAPHNQNCLDTCDLDLGSSGPVLLPGLPRILVGGKEGRIYLLDIGNLGKGPKSPDDIIQCFRATAKPGFLTQLCENNLLSVSSSSPQADGICQPGNQYDKTHNFGQIHGSPAVWTQVPGAQYRIFVQGEYDYLKAFQFDNGFFMTSNQLLTCTPPTTLANPVDQSNDPAPSNTGPGGILSLSSNGQDANSAILWVSIPQGTTPQGMPSCEAEDAQHCPQTGILRAYWAFDLKAKLFELPLDPGLYVKFVPPTIANGRVYVAQIGKVAVFGNTLSPVVCRATLTQIGPETCVAGNGWTPGHEVRDEFYGIPGRTTPLAGGMDNVKSNGSFDIHNLTGVLVGQCSNDQIQGTVTVRVREEDSKGNNIGNGNCTMPAAYWCSTAPVSTNFNGGCP
jgi:hypothetical protein